MIMGRFWNFSFQLHIKSTLLSLTLTILYLLYNVHISTQCNNENYRYTQYGFIKKRRDFFSAQ